VTPIDDVVALDDADSAAVVAPNVLSLALPPSLVPLELAPMESPAESTHASTGGIPTHPSLTTSHTLQYGRAGSRLAHVASPS